MRKGNAKYFYHYNAHGDVIALTNQQGEVVASYQYDAWGNPLSVEEDNSVADNPYRYAGYQFDRETGMYYLMARYYHPTHGVFLSLDPDPGDDDDILTQNGYTYANNNPVNMIDPDGKWAWAVGFAAYDGYKAYKAGKSKKQIAWAVASGFGPGKYIKGAKRAVGLAKSVKQYSNLKEHYRQAQKYGKAGHKHLQNGRIRYYGKISPASSPRPTKGRRLVREWNPKTNNKRTWHESVIHNNKVNQVRILKNGKKVHYRFNNGKLTQKW